MGRKGGIKSRGQQDRIQKGFFPDHNAAYRLGDVNSPMHNSADFFVFVKATVCGCLRSNIVWYIVAGDIVLVERA